MPLWWFWLSIVFISFGFLIGIYRFKLRIFEVIEALVVSLLPLVAIVFLRNYLSTQSIYLLFASLVSLFLFVVFLVIDKHYKRFTWYKSGRIGFSGLTIFGIFFLIRAIVAVFLPSMLSFSGKYEVYLSAIVAFAAFLTLFNLARQKT